MSLEIDNNTLSKTLNQLEGRDLKKVKFNSYLVKESFSLLDKKLKLLKAKDIRILVGQQIGLKYVIPLAFEILKEKPLIEVDFFEGDLLLKVLNVNQSFWEEYPSLKSVLIDIINDNKIIIQSLDDNEIKAEIFNLFEIVRGI